MGCCASVGLRALRVVLSLDRKSSGLESFGYGPNTLTKRNRTKTSRRILSLAPGPRILSGFPTLGNVELEMH
jgi:hypothetical protein